MTKILFRILLILFFFQACQRDFDEKNLVVGEDPFFWAVAVKGSVYEKNEKKREFFVKEIVQSVENQTLFSKLWVRQGQGEEEVVLHGEQGVLSGALVKPYNMYIFGGVEIKQRADFAKTREVNYNLKTEIIRGKDLVRFKKKSLTGVAKGGFKYDLSKGFLELLGEVVGRWKNGI